VRLDPDQWRHSAGDEDHVSKTRKPMVKSPIGAIAINPAPQARASFQARPWWVCRGNPVQPGFARCALATPNALLAGGSRFEPQGNMVPANFYKNKNRGAMECCALGP